MAASSDYRRLVESAFEIVRVEQRNRDDLATVAIDVFDDDIHEASLEGFFAGGGLLVIAVADGVAVGQAQAFVQAHVDGPSQLYIDNLGVTPDLRRQGIARALVDAIRTWGHELGCEQAWIVTDTDTDNREANAFYASLGAERSTVALYWIA